MLKRVIGRGGRGPSLIVTIAFIARLLLVRRDVNIIVSVE